MFGEIQASGKFIFGDMSLGLDCSKRVCVGPSCDRYVRPALAQWLKIPRANVWPLPVTPSFLVMTTIGA